MLLAIVIDFFGKSRRRQVADLRTLSDADLVLQYRQTQDMKIIAILIERYSDPIVGMAMNYLKDEEEVRDFSSNLLIKLSESLKTAEVKHFKSWLCTIVKNRLTDLVRKSKVRTEHRATLSEGSENMDSKVDFALDNRQLFEALQELNEYERLCIEQVYLKEKSYHEVMEETGWKFNQVRGYRDRAIKKLKAKLGGAFADYLKT